MRSRRRVGSASGFTLVEVLVALAITVAVTVTAYTSISAALASAEQLQQNGDRVRDLNRALTILSRDVRQLTNRQVKDEFDDVRAALEGGPLAPHSLALTRSGWHSDGVSPRSNLQRVFYYVEDDSLWRAYYQVLDRLGDREPVRVRLLRGVEDMEVRFLQDIQQLQVSRDLKIDSRNWPRNWVRAPDAAPGSLGSPVALEIRLTLNDFGDIRRLYELPDLGSDEGPVDAQ